MSGIVVIGAGQAGATLVEKLRANGYKGKITLIGEEPHLPYQRPPLSKKYLLGEMEQERLHLRPESFYDENRIDRILGQAVTGIDRKAKTVTLSDGAKVSYDKLALTTGSVPRLLPAKLGGNLKKVFAVRTLADVDAMEPSFADGGHALIIGGGYIGLEAAAVAATKGLQVTLVEMADRILQRVAAPQTSDYFRKLHKGNGVAILEGVGLERLTGEDTVSGAVLSDGSKLSVDFVIVGIGIMPATSLAERAGLKIDNGIAVNESGQTSDPDIYAAGDCCSFPYRGKRIRLESVPNAIDQAGAVAEAMLGKPVQYLAKPWFWSDQYDVKLQIAGLNAGYDKTVVRMGERPGSQSVWYFRGDELLAVDAMNDPRAYMTGKRWIEAGQSPTPEDVCNPDIELKAIKVKPNA
jgi:3-phenylpropionate/trans-cinnamate dioxygenase ferredoxin reductase subunit